MHESPNITAAVLRCKQHSLDGGGPLLSAHAGLLQNCFPFLVLLALLERFLVLPAEIHVAAVAVNVGNLQPCEYQKECRVIRLQWKHGTEKNVCGDSLFWLRASGSDRIHPSQQVIASCPHLVETSIQKAVLSWSKTDVDDTVEKVGSSSSALEGLGYDVIMVGQMSVAVVACVNPRAWQELAMDPAHIRTAFCLSPTPCS
eukprot:2221158-Rhodomonas_salina.4